MVELTSEATSTKGLVGLSSSPCTCKSEPEISANSPLHPLLYVRYKDHVIYKNIIEPAPEAIERETVGWLTHQNEEILLIENDRTIQREGISKGKSNGIIILKSCIIEIRPLQKNLKWHLNCKQPIQNTEYAFRPTERKTHSSKDSKGEN